MKRRARLALLVLAPLAFLLLANAAGWFASSRADARASRLRADVLEASVDFTTSDVQGAWASYRSTFGVPGQPDLAGLLFPDVDTDMTGARLEGELLHISLATGWWLEDRCVIVVLGGDEPTARVEDGSAC